MRKSTSSLAIGGLLLLALAAAWWVSRETQAVNGLVGVAQQAPSQMETSLDAAQTKQTGRRAITQSEPTNPHQHDPPGQETARLLSSFLDLALTGKITDPDGKPLQGVRVQRRQDRSTGFQVYDFDSVGELALLDETRSGSAGEFRFELESGMVSHLTATTEGRGEVVVSGCMPGAFVEIAMPLAAGIEGFVTEKAGLTPVTDAQVRVFHGNDGNSIAETRVDARGYFVLNGLFPGDLELQVVPQEHVMPRLIEVKARAGQTVRRDVEVESGWVLAGQVRNSKTHAPIPGAEVSGWSFLGKTVRTDEQGRYRLEGIRTRPGMLAARAKGFGKTEMPYGKGNEFLDLKLLPGRGVQGRVVDNAGRTIANARVTAAGSTFEDGYKRGEWKSVETDEGGRFRMEDLRSDLRLGLFVRSSGHATTVFPMKHELSGMTDVGDLVLELGTVLDGQVLDGDEVGVSGADVYLSGPKELVIPGDMGEGVRERRAQTDGEGCFRLMDLAAGTWAASVVAPGQGRVRKSLGKPLVLKVGEVHREMVWILPHRAVLKGQVRERGGGALAGVFIRLSPEEGQGGGSPDTRSQASGDFVFEGLAEGGRWTLYAVPPRDEQTAEAPLLPLALRGIETGGGFVEVELARADGVIEGQVVGPDGQPSAQALVSLDAGDGRLHEGILAGDDGRFRLAVPTGKTVSIQAWRTRAMVAEDQMGLLSIEWQLKRRIHKPSEPGARASGLEAGARQVVLRLGE